jgi:hypothetical protein
MKTFTEMTNTDSSWNTAYNLICQILIIAAHEDADIMFDGYVIEPKNIIVDIGNRLIYVAVDNTRVTVYNGDTEYDEGAYTPVEEIEENIRRDFNLYKQIRY